MNLIKILVIDIETAGVTATLADLQIANPRLAELWVKRAAWLRERYPENKDLDDEGMWVLKSGLHPEFAKVVCVTFGSFDVTGLDPFKLVSFNDVSENDILMKTNKVLANAGATGFTLSGHTINRFDVPFLWKRLLINGIKPADMITTYDKKPWDIKFLDIAQFFSGGTWQEGFTSLDTMSALFDIESPKAAMQANRVHENFYKGDYDGIKKYCEGDVLATMKLVSTFSFIMTEPKIQDAI